MSKPFQMAVVIFFCASGLTWAASTEAVQSGDGSIRRQLQQEMLKHEQESQKAEAEFVKTLSGKSAAEQQAALKAHASQKQASEKAFRAGLHAKKAEYRKKVHEERMVYMKAKLDKNSNLSAAEKAAMLSRMETEYKRGADYENKQFAASQELSDKLSDSGLTQEQRAKLLKEQAAASRAAAKAYKEEQIQDKRTRYSAKKSSEVKSDTATIGKGKVKKVVQ